MAGLLAAILSLSAAPAGAQTSTVDVDLTVSDTGSTTPLDSSSYTDVVAALPAGGTGELQVISVPGLPDLTLVGATVDSDIDTASLSIEGTATVLGLPAAVMLTADWQDVGTDTAPVVTFGARFTDTGAGGLALDVVNEAWTAIGGVVPEFGNAWAVVSSDANYAIDFAELPDSAEIFYGTDANGFVPGDGLGFRGELDLTSWAALSDALAAVGIDASSITVEGTVGSAELLFDSSADTTGLDLAVTLDGTGLPSWITSASITIGFGFDGASAPAITISPTISTNLGGAANDFSATITFDPAGSFSAMFALDGGTLNVPFGADFLGLTNPALTLDADLVADPVAFSGTFTADLDIGGIPTALTIGIAVAGSEVTGTFSIDGPIDLGDVVDVFQPLLGSSIDLSAFAVPVTLDGISFTFSTGGGVDEFELSADATVNSLEAGIVLAGSKTSTDSALVLGLSLTDPSASCGCIPLATLLGLSPAPALVEAIELPEVQLLIPLQPTTITTADAGAAMQAFLTDAYGSLPATVELTTGVNLAAQLPLDALGAPVRDALGFAQGSVVTLEGTLGVSLSAFAGGGSLAIDGLDLEATIAAFAPPSLPSWVVPGDDSTLAVSYDATDAAIAVSVDVPLTIQLPGEDPLTGSISGELTVSGDDLTLSMTGTLGSWTDAFGVDWLDLDGASVTIDYADVDGAVSVDASLAATIVIGGTTFDIGVDVSTSGDDFDVAVSIDAVDDVRLGDLFGAVGITDLPAAIADATISGASMNAAVSRASGVNSWSASLIGTMNLSLGGGSVAIDLLLVLDADGEYRVGLGIAGTLTLADLVPSLSDIDFALPDTVLVLSSSATDRSADQLTDQELAFFGPLYGCAAGDTATDCPFDVALPPGLSITANIALPSELDFLQDIGVQTQSGILLQGTLPLFGLGDPDSLAISIDLPAWLPPGSPEWFGGGELDLELSATGFRLAGGLTVLLPKNEDVADAGDFGAAAKDVLVFEIGAELDIDPTSGDFAFTFDGSLSAESPWEQAFGVEWLTVSQLRLQIGVSSTGGSVAFSIGVRGDIAIGDTDLSISVAIGTTPAGVPFLIGLRAASEAGIGLDDIVSVFGDPDSIAGLPSIDLRRILFNYSTVDNAGLCLTQGLIISGDLYISADPFGSNGDVTLPACDENADPAEDRPEAGSDCLDDDDCFASVRLTVDGNGIVAIGQLNDFSLGDIQFEESFIDLRLTLEEQSLRLEGGMSVTGVGEGRLALSFGLTELAFEGEIEIFNAFYASLSGTATLDVPPGLHLEGILRQELGAALNEALRPYFQDIASVIIVINGIIDELQDPDKSIDDAVRKVFAAPADLRDLDVAVPQWLTDMTNGINSGLEAYSDLTGTEGPISTLIDPIMKGTNVVITSGALGTWIPETCLGSTTSDGACWTIEPTPSSSYRIKVGLIKIRIKIPAIPGVPGVVVPRSCLVVVINGTCWAVPPINFQIPGVCAINAVNQAFTDRGYTCDSTGLKNIVVDLFEDAFEEVTGVAFDDAQEVVNELAQTLTGPGAVLIDAPCIAFELDLGPGTNAPDQNSFKLDLQLIVLGQQIFFDDLGWNFNEGVGANALGFRNSILNALLSPGNPASDNQCLGVDPGAGGGGPTIIIGNVAPPTNVTVTPSAGAVNEGSSVTVNGTFAPGTAPTSSIVVTIAWGDGTSSNITPTAGSFTATHVYRDDDPTATSSDTRMITAVVTDDVGTASANTSVTVNNVAPVIDSMALSSSSFVEGDTATLSGTYSDVGLDDTHQLRVTWGDGSSQNVGVSGGTFSISRTFADDIPNGTAFDTYVVTARLTDDDSGSVVASRQLTVHNDAPALTGVVATPSSIDEGQALTLTGSIVDAGVLDLHTITIDWGDGSVPELFSPAVGERSFNRVHSYEDDNPTATAFDDVTVTVTIVDDDTVTAPADTATTTVTVNNVAPSDVTLSFGSIVLSEGDETAVFVTFADPGRLDEHTITINWGDDSTSSTATLAVGQRQVLLTHLYEDDNPTGTPQDTYPITVVVADDDGASVSEAVAETYDAETDTYVIGIPIATISNVAPEFEPTPGEDEVVPTPLILSPQIDENGTAELTATFADPGLRDTFEVVIDWGDGTPVDTVQLDQSDRPDPELRFVEFSAQHQYRDDNPTGTASDSYTVTITATDDDTGTDSITGTVIVDDVAPVVEAAPLTQAPQYSDPISDITLTAYDVVGYAGPTETLVATTEWAYGGGAFQTGLPAALALTSDGCSPGGEPGSTGPRQTCEWTVDGIADVAPGLYTIRFTVTDDDGLTSSTDVVIDLQPEDAFAFYTGPSFASTASANSGSAVIELRATIWDSSVGDLTDTTPGDITNAIVDFIDRDTGAVLCTSSVDLLFAGNEQVGVAACDWSVELSNNADAEDFVVGTVVRGWYTRNETDDDAIVVVARPLDQFITGGGYLDFTDVNNSAGVYAADDGTKSNFGFNVKFNKQGTNLKGRATVIVRSEGRVYRIKTNALDSLGIVDGSAEFEAKANITDVTDEDNSISLGGGLRFQMRMTDFDTPADVDTIGWTLYDKDGILLFSSDWNGFDTVEREAQGSLKVH